MMLLDDEWELGGRQAMRMTRVPAYPLAYAAICALAVLLNQYFGYIGYMPLDQSIVFNGAWRILNGQIPYVDFWTPFGLVPMLLQAAMFHAVGITWTSYVLHASLVSAFFACCVLFAGTRLGLRMPFAVLYAAIAAIIGYPPMGTPYIDTHAAILSAIMILAVLFGIFDPRQRRLWWALAPPLAILAFLSKQIPSLYAVLFCGAAMVAVVWCQRRATDLFSPALSAAACLLVTFWAFHGFGVSWGMFRMQTIDSAQAIAQARLGLSEPHDNVLLAAAGVLRRVASLSKGVLRESIHGVPVFPVFAVPVFIAAIAAFRVRTLDAIALSAFSAGAFLVFVVFSALTYNQPATALPLLALASPLAHGALIACGVDRRISNTLGVFPVVAAALMQTGWTDTRYANDLATSTLAQATDAVEVSPRLAHLQWIMPPNHPGERDPGKYRQLILELSKHAHPAVIFSDGVIDALVDRNPVAPALFWHKQLAYPVDGRARELFDDQFKRRIVEAGSDLLVVDGPQTFMATRYTEFPWLVGCLQVDRSRAIGKFSLIPLDPACVKSLARVTGK